MKSYSNYQNNYQEIILQRYTLAAYSHIKLSYQVHLEYTAAALFEEFYAIEGVNKAASPDSFYRAIEDIVFTPFDYDSERNNINVQEPVEKSVKPLEKPLKPPKHRR